MTAVWKDIDPNQAEAALRSLQRRIAELEVALRDQSKILEARPNSFAFKLGHQSLIEMQNKLHSEQTELLAHRVAEKLDIALDGGAFGNNTANVGALGVLLIRLQKLYSSIAQSIAQGPTLRGPIATGIMELTELRLASTYPSSFGMSLIVAPRTELVANSLPSDALAGMFSLLSSSNNENDFMRLSGELGGRSVNHLKHIARILGTKDSELSLEWSDSTGIKHYWHASSVDARSMLNRLELIKETRSESKVMTGRIVGASLLRNRFEMIRDDGVLVEGKITSTAVGAVANAFGHVCSVHIDETEVADYASGITKTYYSLTAILPLIENQSPQITQS